MPITSRPATLDDAAHLYPRLRSYETTLGIEKSIASSFLCRTGLVDGEIACIGGLGRVGDMIVPWLLSSDLIERHAMAFGRQGRTMFRDLLKEHHRFDGIIDVKHPHVVRWMRFLGCTVSEDIETFPALNLQFRRFFIEYK